MKAAAAVRGPTETNPLRDILSEPDRFAAVHGRANAVRRRAWPTRSFDVTDWVTNIAIVLSGDGHCGGRTHKLHPYENPAA